jgi:hypothetical protein
MIPKKWRRGRLTANEVVEALEDALLPVDGYGVESFGGEETGDPLVLSVGERDAVMEEPS